MNHKSSCIVFRLSKRAPLHLFLPCLPTRDPITFVILSSIFLILFQTSMVKRMFLKPTSHLSFCSYFRCLVEQFEVQLQQYRRQIEELENHLTTQGSGSHITPQGRPLPVTPCLS